MSPYVCRNPSSTSHPVPPALGGNILLAVELGSGSGGTLSSQGEEHPSGGPWETREFLGSRVVCC